MTALRFVLLAAVLCWLPGVTRAQGSDPPGALTLQETARRALEHFPVVRGARADVAAASASKRMETASWFPDLRWSAEATRYEKPSIVYPFHSLTEFPPFSRTVFSADVGVSYLLFDFGGRMARVREAGLKEQASRSALSGSEMEVLAQTAAKYLEILTRREVLRAQEARLAALRSERERVLRLLAAGKAARVDSLRVEAELDAAQAESLGYGSDLHLAERELTGLTGIARDSTRAENLIPVELAPESLPPVDAEIAQALQANPDLKAAVQTADAARAAASASRAERWPRLSAAGTYQVWTDPDGNSNGEWNAGVSLTQTLFTGGEITGRIHKEEAAGMRADENVRLSRITTARAVQDTHDRFQEADARVASLQTAVAGYAEVARIEALSLSAGAGIQTDYLRAEADLFDARARLAEAERARIVERVDLARLTGDLTLDWLAARLEARP